MQNSKKCKCMSFKSIRCNKFQIYSATQDDLEVLFWRWFCLIKHLNLSPVKQHQYVHQDNYVSHVDSRASTRTRLSVLRLTLWQSNAQQSGLRIWVDMIKLAMYWQRINSSASNIKMSSETYRMAQVKQDFCAGIFFEWSFWSFYSKIF